MADRNGRLESRRDHPVAPRDPRGDGRATSRSGAARILGRLYRHPTVPRCDLPDQRAYPDRISGRVAFLEVDGQRIEGTLVPLAPPGTTVHVEAVVR